MSYDVEMAAPDVARAPAGRPFRDFISDLVVAESADHFLAIVAAVHHPLRRLLLVTLEQGALRLGEAISLTWGDVDRAGLRLRLPRSATKRDHARWVYLPEWLIEAI